MEKSHDLRLAQWGPYTKAYAGISHLANAERGMRFDVSVFPGFYRRKLEVPNVRWEGNWYPWQADSDLTNYSYRHMLEWQDRVYTDVAFGQVSDSGSQISIQAVNRTDHHQSLALHFAASMHFPQIRGHGEILQKAQLVLPPSAVWLDALSFTSICYARRRPTFGLTYDGWREGEIRAHHFVGGTALAKGFGQEAADEAVYHFTLPAALEDAICLIRCRISRGYSFNFQLIINGQPEQVKLTGTGEIELYSCRIGDLASGATSLVWQAEGPASQVGQADLELDGFAFLARKDQQAVHFYDLANEPVPEIRTDLAPQSLLLQYTDCDYSYGLAWDNSNYEIREIFNSELDAFLRHNVNEHVAKKLYGDRKGHFTNVFLRPLTLEPHSEMTIQAAVFSGSRAEVIQQLKQYQPAKSLVQHTAKVWPASPAGAPYTFGRDRLAATLLTNVVYPVYTKGSYIRHHTPGRWWDSLYTWDSGFLGLGLLELDLERALDNLSAYLTAPGDWQAAFIHHGSMVPVQFYLWLEMWNKTRSRQLAERFYPSLRQYYLYFAGFNEHSSTRPFASNLLQTWAYFYNSGGWDDYPAQAAVHRRQLADRTCPVITTAHAIRIAKILRLTARQLGDQAEDIAMYSSHIAGFEAALEKAWHEESGYYGYTVHDEKGEVDHLLHDEAGNFLNQGLDGLYPLVAGVFIQERYQGMLAKLKSKDQLWSPIGLSVVDQSAPYYSQAGYWNGAVWMPHQWFIWKTMLDCGESDFAWQIARTALELWQKETSLTYCCFEHFIIESGRGAGWHQFGGLSSPILNWFAAYFTPGTVNLGLDGWVTSCQLNEDLDCLELKWLLDQAAAASPAPYFTIIVSLKAEQKGLFKLSGTPVTASQERFPGVFELSFARGANSYQIRLEKQGEAKDR